MPEDERGSELPCPWMGLPGMVDTAGGDYARSVQDMEAVVDELVAEAGETAEAHLMGTWPNGEPFYVVTSWPERGEPEPQ